MAATDGGAASQAGMPAWMLTDEIQPEEYHQINVSYGLIIASAVLSLIVCGTRLYTRKFILGTFGLDDWLVVLGLTLTQGYNILGILMVANGMGKHINHVPDDQLALWFKLFYIGQVVYLIVSMAVKSSLLCFLRRVFPTKWIQHATSAIFIVLALFFTGSTFAVSFQCNPASGGYDMKAMQDPNTKCFSKDTQYNLFLSQGIIIIMTDFLILLMPFPILWTLKMNTSKTLGLALVFSSGIIACIAPIVRFSTLKFHLSDEALTDITFSTPSSLYWMIIEYNLGMVAGSLSSLRTLFNRFGLFGSTNAGSGHKHSGGFTPSYQLKNMGTDGSGSGSGGGSKGGWMSRKGNRSSHVQGQSVLEPTRIDNDSEEHIIVKTSHVTISNDAASRDENEKYGYRVEYGDNRV